MQREVELERVKVERKTQRELADHSRYPALLSEISRVLRPDGNLPMPA